MAGKSAGIPQDRAISEALDRDGKVYRKTGEYRAERTTVPTRVETVLNGKVETVNTAYPDDYVVTGAAGERYVVKPDVFASRYEPKTGQPGVYLARGHVKAIPNPFGRPLHILAHWGEVQNGDTDCMIVDIYDPAKGTRFGHPYLISRAVFDATYKPAGPAASSPAAASKTTPWYRK
jgi:hypothetical protein